MDQPTATANPTRQPTGLLPDGSHPVVQIADGVWSDRDPMARPSLQVVPGRLHTPALGPVPCQGCGMWVEWAPCCGWLALAADDSHECLPAAVGAVGMTGAPGVPGPVGPSLSPDEVDRLMDMVDAWKPAPLPMRRWYHDPATVMALGLAAIFLVLALARAASGLL